MPGIMSRLGLDGGALLLGVLLFGALYVIGAMLIIFVLSLLTESFGSEPLERLLRIGGYLSLGLPAYAAARLAGRNGWRHGMVLGAIEGAAIVALMTFTFSWEGTVHNQVVARMLPVFLLVFALGVAGGGLGEWRNRRGAAR